MTHSRVRLAPTPEEIATLRELVETQALSQRVAAERMGWPLRRVERLIPRLGIRTHPRGRHTGPAHGSWKEGRIVDKDGYVLLWCAEKRRKHTHYVLEHHLVMEAHIGRRLRKGEVVHHRDKNKANNQIENLELFASNAEHLRAELTGHCPKWTEDGKAAILAAAQRKADTARQRKAQGESSPP